MIKIKTFRSEKPPKGNNQLPRVLVVPGFSEGIFHARDLVDALGDDGMDATTFSQPRIRRIKGDPIVRQAEVVSGVLDSLPSNEKVHAVAHSLGGAAVLKAARDNPEAFASITLLQPVGMTSQQGLKKLVKRTGKKTIKNFFQSLAVQDSSPYSKKNEEYPYDKRKSTLRYMGRVILAQILGGIYVATRSGSLKEATAAGQYRIEDDMKAVMDLGVPVHVVTSASDEIFPYEEIDFENLDATSFSSVADRKAGHDTFLLQPIRTADTVKKIITSQVISDEKAEKQETQKL